MKQLTGLVALACLAALPAFAQDSFPGTEYVSGKDGFPKKLKGTLVVTETEVRFTNDKGAPIFTVPMSSVTEAKASREHEEGSFGRKMALGVFASKNAEYLEIHTRSDKGAEGIVFKTKKKQSPTMAEKIMYYAEKTGKKKK